MCQKDVHQMLVLENMCICAAKQHSNIQKQDANNRRDVLNEMKIYGWEARLSIVFYGIHRAPESKLTKRHRLQSFRTSPQIHKSTKSSRTNSLHTFQSPGQSNHLKLSGLMMSSNSIQKPCDVWPIMVRRPLGVGKNFTNGINSYHYGVNDIHRIIKSINR